MPVSFPVHVAAGELFNLSQLPLTYRKSLTEGEDYRTNWTHQELAEIRKEQEDIYLGLDPGT